MLADYGLIAIGMIQMGEPRAWVSAGVMWVTGGNGLRFGPRYLAAAIALAMASFVATVLLTPYWRANPGLALSLLLGCWRCPCAALPCCAEGCDIRPWIPPPPPPPSRVRCWPASGSACPGAKTANTRRT
ncbi:hypothetical protein G6F40_016498 [Rhizopus arrhizus]|nr:hypothetical protein G6F40_016498 [Rhizopus arrhizus]